MLVFHRFVIFVSLRLFTPPRFICTSFVIVLFCAIYLLRRHYGRERDMQRYRDHNDTCYHHSTPKRRGQQTALNVFSDIIGVGPYLDNKPTINALHIVRY